MNTLARHFNAMVTEASQQGAQWSLEDDAQLASLLADCEGYNQKLEACESLESLMAEASGINKQLAGRFAEYGFEDFDFETYPLASFTDLPSGVNLDVTMESFDKYKKLLIGGGIAGILLLLAKFIKWLLNRDSGQDNSPASNVSTHENVSRDADRMFKSFEEYRRDLGRAAKKASRARHETPRAEPLPAPHLARVEDHFPPTPTGDDRPSAAAVRDEVLEAWYPAVDEMLVEAFKTVLKNPNTQFNLPFLKAIVDDKLYDDLGDVIQEMNKNLVELDRYFEKGIKIVADTDHPDLKTMAKSKRHLSETVVDPLSDVSDGGDAAYNAYSTTPTGSGFTKARAIVIRYAEFMTKYHQDDFVPMELYSESFARDEERANPSQVVGEVFRSIQAVSNQKIRYRGDDLTLPDKFLAKVQKWIEVQNKNYAKRDDLNAMHASFLKRLQATAVEVTKVYGGTLNLLKQHSVEIQKVEVFFDAFVKRYNEYVPVYVKKAFLSRGYTDTREFQKELKEVVDILSVKVK